MLNKSFVALSAVVVSSALLQGCMTAPTVGAAPSDTPPRIIVDPNDSKSRMWDRPGAFGPVPESQAARAESTCSSLNRDGMQFKAIGYHPKALDMEGKEFAGGGFLCFRK